MSAFCFSIFVGISVLFFAFLLPNLLVSFKTWSTLIFEKLKLYGFLIANSLGWLQNLILLSKQDERCILLKNQYLWILEFSIFYYVSKKSQFNILAFSSSLVIIFLHVLIEFFQKILLHLAKEVLLFSRTSCCRSHLFHLNSRSNLFHFFSKDVHRNYVTCCNWFY